MFGLFLLARAKLAVGMSDSALHNSYGIAGALTQSNTTVNTHHAPPQLTPNSVYLIA